MAAKFEISITTNDLIFSSIWKQALENGITVKRASVLHDWDWDTEREIKQDIALLPGDVLFLDLFEPQLKTFGASIEVFPCGYRHSVWIDTESYPALDKDWVDESNEKFYKMLCDRLSCFLRKYAVKYEWIAAGIELDLPESFCPTDFVDCSNNATFWIFPRPINHERMQRSFVRRYDSDLAGWVYERKKYKNDIEDGSQKDV